jgi:hypothetical protein
MPPVLQLVLQLLVLQLQEQRIQGSLFQVTLRLQRQQLVLLMLNVP